MLIGGERRKFGKHIQKRQLDIPEYAASFVDYKALKKLIKKLSATPVLAALHQGPNGEALQDAQASLQANKATFFFRLERELEKVNTFYLQKEAELKLRLKSLLDKKRGVQSRATPASKLSSSYVTLDEGFRLFSNDLDKLQQFVEVNQTAFSKILKKWDKTSKSRTKELYLSRAVDVQPCFNRDVISDLSDQATTGLLELQAWAEGEKIAYTPAVELENRIQPSAQDEEVENQVLQAINAGNSGLVREWSSRTAAGPDAAERISRVFLNTVNHAAPSAQEILYNTGLVNFNYADSINERNCIHEAAVSGRSEVLAAALTKGANIRAPDVYGRLPLHYACMHGRVDMVKALVAAEPDTIDFKDLDHFTPLIHGIVHSQTGSVQEMLQFGAIVNQTSSTSHIPLNLACQYGSAPIVQQILRFQPQILPDAEGLYPQHLVARFGRDNQILQMLKDYGVDMDQPDKLYQWTPIFHAASEGHLECLRQLLEFKVDPAALDEKDLNAMYYAAWEGKLDCMQLLAQAGAGATGDGFVRDPMDLQPAPGEPPPLTIAATPTFAHPDAENIPSLELPPPIIPLRRYGHNFLDTTKTFIQLSFGEKDGEAIEFYGDSKYPAARLTISSKSSGLIPRNLPLPIQDDLKNVSFQIENLDNFSIDFDIYPTFGSKVIARAAASSRVFTGKASSSGLWHLELFDPRLRAIGRITFRYQVVTPFHGIPLEITHFATYWKATSQIENHPSNLITGSSLSGDFLRLFVQVTSDGVPVLYNKWALPSSRNDLISRLTYQEFRDSALQAGLGKGVIKELVNSGIDRENLAEAQQRIAQSCSSLESTLAILPADLHVELHVCYPTRLEENALQLGPTQNINVVVDGVLQIVFDHARLLRELSDSPQRSFVFSSYNSDVCTALNWKQPNYPVLLCNELGVAPPTTAEPATGSTNMVINCGRTDLSIKESVRIAQSNNFMGLICTSRLLDLVPALVSSVKEAGLVLISDYSNDRTRTRAPTVLSLPKGADGLLLDNAVLRFKDQIDQ
ncbi:Putative SPX domain, PLC-like phosphodiesterase, TIM beta/alpha-barrel domain superfamily [Septoria linicola]|uniref:SPX domain, PLC-like phosphodiesterase, TIM beta/alpha-barrel domain superfamily n=1 Tax=Septoria linicola TaxID=215465 RepID=A0A9Q9B726_9PEZI|nr:Putative SPX domain, PLC-like phosphodiesterase, TIM beta/alpha-barrel domain superfamily [Septoria linicola]